MFEKVNPAHPDKIADRIAGAIVDLSYKKKPNPTVAVEVLIGHGVCQIINETDTYIKDSEIQRIVNRIVKSAHSEFIEEINYRQILQDYILSLNQQGKMKCGDNGIYKASPITSEQARLTIIAKTLYRKYQSDGKYMFGKDRKLTICQSHASAEGITFTNSIVNPLGYWTGGLRVDSGATNRKLGSDYGNAMGGGLHGKDLSKPDTSVAIYAFLKAQETKQDVEISCSIGDEQVDGRPYEEIVEIARDFIKRIGGFEKLAEWGLIR